MMYKMGYVPLVVQCYTSIEQQFNIVGMVNFSFTFLASPFLH